MEKQDIRFIKDYTTVLRYVQKDKNVDIYDVNDILLSDKYYKNYMVEMKNQPDYQQAFLKFYEKDFEEKLTIAKNLIADRNKEKKKFRM